MDFHFDNTPAPVGHQRANLAITKCISFFMAQ